MQRIGVIKTVQWHRCYSGQEKAQFVVMIMQLGTSESTYCGINNYFDIHSYFTWAVIAED